MSFVKFLRNIKIVLLAAVSLLLLGSIYLIHTTDFGTSNKFEAIYNYKRIFGNSKEDSESESVELEPNVWPKRDWTDREYVAGEALREGPGERGLPVILKTQRQLRLSEASVWEYSYNGVTSDAVSLDRSVPDTRPEQCLSRQYYKDLPSASVVIVFHNEYLSFLLRTVHSIVNRTPKELLAEIILVDDCSSKEFLLRDLDSHIAAYRPDIVKVVRLTKRSGLMQARMAGIRAAKSDIVVVMDAHMEVNTNWLPPLLEPIVDDPRVATEPVVNYIHWNTLKYDPKVDIGTRGGFSWNLDYDVFPRVLSKGESPADNFLNPVFLGAIMAINKTFFWQLGGYDDQLRVWGGEQYDISFKIWMCGEGKILRVPCSQVGHNYKEGGHHPFFQMSRGYIPFNYARIAEVWMEEYKDKYYNSSGRYNSSYGDITKQLNYRRSHCRSFKWFIENIFPVVQYDFPIDNLIKSLVLLVGILCFLVGMQILYMLASDVRAFYPGKYQKGWRGEEKLLKV